jgi:acetylornithine deacetylase
VDAVLEAARKVDPALQVKRRHLLTRDPFEASPDGALAVAVRDAVTEVRGTRPAVIGETPWMDSAILAAHGIETVVCGPAGVGAHATEEWVDLESVAQLAAVLARAARAYCGPGSA